MPAKVNKNTLILLSIRFLKAETGPHRAWRYDPVSSFRTAPQSIRADIKRQASQDTLAAAELLHGLVRRVVLA
ncbi:MAG: hypothetical protein ACK5VB_05735, partial [Bacteroidota bacterium]